MFKLIRFVAVLICVPDRVSLRLLRRFSLLITVHMRFLVERSVFSVGAGNGRVR